MRRLVVIFLSMLPWCLVAQTARFVNYGPDNGLISTSVYAITQDRDGMLWIGTRGGLFRFDGRSFTPFNDGLPASRVTSLAVDRDNHLWVGTVAGLMVRGEGRALEGQHVRALLTDSDGFVWAASLDSSLVRMTLRDGIRETARGRYNYRYFEGDYPYQQVFEDEDGLIWMGGRIVNCQYFRDREHPVSVAHPTDRGPMGSYAVLDGTLYAFNDYYNTLCTVDTLGTRALGELPVRHATLLSDSKGRLWAAGSYGLGLVNIEKPEATFVHKHDPADPSSLASSELYCIFEDREGNIWVGGDNGLSVLCPALQQVHPLPLPSRQVTALLQTRNGSLWAGTADSGAYVLDGKEVTHVDYRPAGRPNEGHVSCLYEDSAGAVYIGLWAGCGFNIWENGRIRRGAVRGPVPDIQLSVYSDRERFYANWIADFLEGSDGRFWVVTWEGAGMNEWDRRSGETLPVEWVSPFFFPTPQTDSCIYLSSRLGSRLIEDAAGNLVYGTTEAGLNIIDRETRLVTKYLHNPLDSLSIPDSYVTDLCFAPDGTLWAATRGGLWSPSGAHHLDGKLVQSVRADSAGRLWAGTEEGLYFIDTDGSVGCARKALGFPSDVYGEHAACVLSDGRLAFGGLSGAAVFHPDSLLSIRAAGSLPLMQLVQHRYRLNKGEWTYQEFDGIPENFRPGRYLLEEQSTDVFGRWEHGQVHTQEIRVPQPLLLRWPFLLGYLLLLGGLVLVVIRLRERRLLMSELDTRNRFFSIITHDLRNPLTGNRMLTRQLLEQADSLTPEQMKEGLQALSKSADNTSALLENLLLWSLSQKGMLEPVMREEKLDSLAAEAAESVQGSAVIELDIPADLTVRTDRNMLLTCLRNLLENAVKYTPEGGKVTLSARGRSISVSDQGPGLTGGGTAWGHGLGLVITRELLEKMGATLDARNRPSGGLEVTIRL